MRGNLFLHLSFHVFSIRSSRLFSEPPCLYTTAFSPFFPDTSALASCLFPAKMYAISCVFFSFCNLFSYIHLHRPLAPPPLAFLSLRHVSHPHSIVTSCLVIFPCHLLSLGLPGPRFSAQCIWGFGGRSAPYVKELWDYGHLKSSCHTLSRCFMLSAYFLYTMELDTLLSSWTFWICVGSTSTSLPHRSRLYVNLHQVGTVGKP